MSALRWFWSQGQEVSRRILTVAAGPVFIEIVGSLGCSGGRLRCAGSTTFGRSCGNLGGFYSGAVLSCSGLPHVSSSGCCSGANSCFSDTVHGSAGE